MRGQCERKGGEGEGEEGGGLRHAALYVIMNNAILRFCANAKGHEANLASAQALPVGRALPGFQLIESRG